MINTTLILLFFTTITITKLVDYHRNYSFYSWYDKIFIVILWVAFLIQIAGLVAIALIEMGVL